MKLRVLSASDIAEIQDKEEEVERKFKGIEWTRRQVFEVFEFLSNIAKDQEIKLCAGEFASCFSGSISPAMRPDTSTEKRVSRSKRNPIPDRCLSAARQSRRHLCNR